MRTWTIVIVLGLWASVAHPQLPNSGGSASCPASSGDAADQQMQGDRNVRTLEAGRGILPPKLKCVMPATAVLNAPVPGTGTESVESDCIVRLTIDTAGVPHGVKVIRSNREGLPKKLRDVADDLDSKAIAAVGGYRFYPAVFQGKPVQVSMEVKMHFRTRH